MGAAELIPILNLILVTITLAVLVWQVIVQRRQLYDQHEWNRRAESVKYSGFFHPEVKQSRDVLDEHFGIYTRADSIPLDSIKAVLSENPHVQADINYLLTYYENVAIACNNQIADKQIVKSMMKGSYVKFRMLIANYIDWRRTNADNKKLWSNFTAMAAEWEAADSEVRTLPRTGG